jgi:hypothetical protein
MVFRKHHGNDDSRTIEFCRTISSLSSVTVPFLGELPLFHRSLTGTTGTRADTETTSLDRQPGNNGLRRESFLIHAQASNVSNYLFINKWQ